MKRGPGHTVLFWLLTLFAPVLACAENHRIEAAPPGLVESGLPDYTILGKEALGLRSRPLDLYRLPDGRMLVAGSHDLSIGDGIRWETFSLAENDVNCVAEQILVNEKAEMFLGVRDGIARIQLEGASTWKTVLVDDLRALNLGIFGCVLPGVGRSYWHYRSGLVMEWSPGTPPKLHPCEGGIETLFLFKGVLHASDYLDNTLKRLTKDRLETVPVEGSEQHGRILAAIPYDQEHLLVGTSNGGVRLFDGTRLLPFTREGLLSEELAIPSLCEIPGGYFAASVAHRGVVIFNRQGEIVQLLSSTMDQRLAFPGKMVYTKEGVLWIMLQESLARIEFPSRFSRMEALIPRQLSYAEPFRHKGQLWLLADYRLFRGLYSREGLLQSFVPDSPEGKRIWHAASLRGRLLASAGDEMFERSGDQWSLLARGPENARFIRTPGDEGPVLFVARNQTGWLELGAGTARLVQHPAPGLGDVYGTQLEENGTLWCELGNGKAARIDTRARGMPARIYQEKDGLRPAWISIFSIDGITRFNASGYFLRLDPSTDSMVEDTDLRDRYPQLCQGTTRALRDPAGRIWGTDQERIILIDSSGPAPRLIDEPTPQGYRPYDFTIEDDGVAWAFDRYHLLRYDPALPASVMPEVRPIITRVDLPSTGNSLNNPGTEIPALESQNNTVILHYCAPANNFSQQVSFEFRLGGPGEAWTSAGTQGSTTLSRLHEGSYVFMLRCLVDRVPGPVTALHFVIHPPWFRTSGAYAAYAILVLCALATLIVVPSRLREARSRELRRLVEERTAELKEAKELLEQRVQDRTRELSTRVAEVEALNRRLDLLASDLSLANKELESFSYSVSHDLKAPLRNLTGFVELLERRLSTAGVEGTSHFLEVIRSEASRMGALINGLLEISRNLRAEMKQHPVNLNLLVANARRTLAPDQEGRDIEWVVASLPMALGDEALLTQVFNNLLGNAVKYSRKQPKARIEIGCLPDVDEQGRLQLFVRDNGAGFDPKYADRLFGVFQRLHSPKEFEGTGIGLANVKRIILRHGGSIRAEASPGKGACFHFTLPCPDDKPPPPLP